MENVQLQILSDIHLESPAAYDVFKIDPKAPFLALLGDIGYVKDEGFFLFLRTQLENFRLVFLVLGNHEAYHSSWTETKSDIQRFKGDIDASAERNEGLGKLILLDRTRYDISPTVTILGCTLFSSVAPEQKESVSFGINDFYHIHDWSVETHQAEHNADVAWLNREIVSISGHEPERRVVVLTHFCPSTHENVIDPKHRNSKISSGFMTDLSNEPCWKEKVVALWGFGHTHLNCDYQDPATGKRVVSNQRGYYFSQSPGFDSVKVIDV
ncbi:hypothetical protein ABOM_000538 [Aspergillus bombycis]|uniref:Calcineurin-like phosphoesterase domain-containing protein n=1 Tax=Aspergillus bombycis TaxID=109264 RepID=A0A1F8AGC0_9EURO|nr:hypothetical protein ABOM_000538 [Aspergillus bombycis]OGM50727.1 hypothetical protein ABOM_000538 [Aspergillus bombycis]